MTCLQVPAAVLRCGGVPVIIDTSQDLVLSGEQLSRLQQKPDIVVAVHQWGLYCDLSALRNVVGTETPIVEDTANAWGVNTPKFASYRIADVVVTSMGEGKPLDIGGGGAAFANGPISNLIDTWSPGQKERTRPALAAALSMYAFPHLPTAVNAANESLRKYTQLLPYVTNVLKKNGLSYGISDNYHQHCCQLLPVKTNSERDLETFRQAPEANLLGVCLPLPLDTYAMLRNCRVHCRRLGSNRWLLLNPTSAADNPVEFEKWAQRVC